MSLIGLKTMGEQEASLKQSLKKKICVLSLYKKFFIKIYKIIFKITMIFLKTIEYLMMFSIRKNLNLKEQIA